MTDVRVARVSRTEIVTLSRPEARNALTKSTVLALAAAIDRAAADADVRAVVLTGAGGHFCAGADLRRTMAEDPEFASRLDVYMDAFHGVIRSIVRCPKPVVASFGGAAVGFGADIALAADFRVVATDAYIQEKFVDIGLMPDGGGTFWLPRLVGTARAMRVMLLSEKLDAEALDELGLVVACVPPERLAEATRALTDKLERGAPLAYAAVKAAALASLGDLEAALAREREGQIRLLQSSDLVEGVSAWAQKREPRFTGT